MAEETLFKLRVRYSKTSNLRYLSHLEVLHALERLVQRAGLPYAITQGFSPHMRIAFGPALPVGVGSSDEWFDLILRSCLPVEEALARLRASAVEDLMPTEASYVEMRADSLSACLTISRYEVLVYSQMPDGSVIDVAESLLGELEEAVRSTLEAGSIDYLRSGKKKSVLLEGKVASEPIVSPALAPNGSRAISMCFATRSSNEGSLRPDVLMKEIIRRRTALVAAEREQADQRVKQVVSSDVSELRARITRVAQYLESEDGTWLRPI